jgi:cyanophycin synthetase
VAEHVAIELQSLAGSRVTRGKTRSVKGRPGVYNVMYAYEHEAVGLLAGRIAFQVIDHLLPAELRGVAGLDIISERVDSESPWNFEDLLGRLRALNADLNYGPSTASLVQEAERRGIPVARLDQHSLVQLGHGRKQQRVRAAITGRTSFLGVEAAGDKDLTKVLLLQAGVPVPRGGVTTTAQGAVKAADSVGYPVVVKPLDGNHGRGVSVGLMSKEEVCWAFEQAAKHARHVVIEKQLDGKDFRILVVSGQVVAVSERMPAHVIGNGHSTLAELIELENRNPKRGAGHEKPMTRIVVDDQVRGMLVRAQLTLDSVPTAGRLVQLRATANLSTGGSAIDRTDEIHADNALFARRAAAAIGLDVAGIDFICPDISRSARETGGGVVEVNASPGLRMHLHPSQGTPRNVARPIVATLFPAGCDGRIPIFAITGTNGKSTTARMLESILRQNGCCVGLTSTSGVFVGGERIVACDASGPKSARMVLRDPTVEVAVLETARGGILREGLGFEECDVGAVLNVSPDHLGLKGVDTLQDLANVKSVVVEAVRRHGHSILNADDPYTASMAMHAGGRVVYFSMRPQSDWPDFLGDHITQGGLALTCNSDGMLLTHNDGEPRLLMRAAEIPATLNGAAEFNVQNALAAAAMALAHGIPRDVIRKGLGSFTSSFDQNPGRLNIIDTHRCRVILDYAHNPAGLAALGKVLSKMRTNYSRVIGSISMPGDRRDLDIRAMGELAATIFDEVVFWEDGDRRGRERGSIAALLAQGALAAGPGGAIRQIVDECAAAEACLKAAQPGDLVVLTATNVDEVWHRLPSWTKMPIRRKRKASGIERQLQAVS